MKFLATTALILALAGCSSVREGMAIIQRTADEGIGIRSTALAAQDDATQSEADAEADGNGRLPAGLVGDTENRRYTTDAPPAD